MGKRRLAGGAGFVGPRLHGTAGPVRGIAVRIAVRFIVRVTVWISVLVSRRLGAGNYFRPLSLR